MKVEPILRAKGGEVRTIAPDASVSLAAHRMSTERIGCLVVTRDGARVDGRVPDRALVRARARPGTAAAAMRIADVMSVDVPWCHLDDDLAEVMQTMTRRRYRHVPVVDGKRLVGLVSIGDVVKHRLEELELEKQVLRERYLATR